MASSLAKRWNIIDRFLQAMRFRRVVPHIPPKSVLLDIGCGDGAFLSFVSPHIAYGYGVDPYLQADLRTDNYTLMKVDMNHSLPFEDGLVDVVTALAVVEHLSNPENFFEETSRVLKKGGTLLFTTPAPHSAPLLEFLAFKLRIISAEDIRDHKTYFSRESVLPFLRRFASVRYTTFQFGLNQFFLAIK